MANFNLETVTQALATRLFAIPGWKTMGRKPLFEDLTPSTMPAIFVVPAGVRVDNGNRFPSSLANWYIEYAVYIYCRNEAKIGPFQDLNNKIMAIDDALGPQVAEVNAFTTGQGTTTLGGLVRYAQINSVETDEGSNGDNAAAVIRIEALAST